MNRLEKSDSDKVLTGVCGGLATWLGWDATLVRILFVALSIFGFGSFILLYLVMAVIMPKPGSV